MNFREYAKQLLDEYDLCCRAKPKNNAVDIQIEKDSCSIWAVHLSYVMIWGDENEIAEAIHQLESRLKLLKEKIVIEVLTNGTI
jgi:uncharacterized protein with PhoU and TrkA domain